MVQELKDIIREMKEEAALASREAAGTPPIAGRLLLDGYQVRGVVAAAIEDNLLYWATRLEKLEARLEK